VLAVVGTAFVLLLVMFRSPVLALKAGLMNVLSVAAAYGVVTALFQWGWGLSFLGIPHAVPVNVFVPVLMFTILFGLSMDYEVFLLSRIRDERLASGDDRVSVVRGTAATARVITSAALIMVTVFLGFAADPTVLIKMLGVGLATSVTVDATIVRLVLVPATMTLLGQANWYLPRWLDRLLPHLEHSSLTEVPAASAAPVPAPRVPALVPSGSTP
jgi:RND superfamily putative drug exporter